MRLTLPPTAPRISQLPQLQHRGCSGVSCPVQFDIRSIFKKSLKKQHSLLRWHKRAITFWAEWTDGWGVSWLNFLYILFVWWFCVVSPYCTSKVRIFVELKSTTLDMV